MRALVCLSVALALAACGGCGPEETTTAPPPRATDGEPASEPRTYEVTLRGPRPWNDTVYAAVGTFDEGDPFGGRIVDGRNRFSLEGRPGDPYLVRSEIQPIAAEKEILWQIEHRGVLGEEASFEITAPERAVVRALAPATSPGPDVLTVVREDTGTASTVLRDAAVSLFLCVFDAKTSRNWRHVCPPRPFSFDEWAPGPCVVAGRTKGHQWVARRVDLSPGATIDLDLGGQPEGGGTVVCETAAAWLLLDGDLPVPAPRVNTNQHYRATWKGVPPGEHAVRYPDGHETTIRVEDGKTVKLPKR